MLKTALAVALFLAFVACMFLQTDGVLDAWDVLALVLGWGVVLVIIWDM